MGAVHVKQYVQKAIITKANFEGFTVPEIDKEKCVSCGLCDKKCSYLNQIPSERKLSDALCKDELREYYNAADLFALMTRGDTWGLVINEAMANGLPVITTKRCVAGVELIKDGENGYIIDVDDTEALVNKILTLRDNEELCRQMSLANINEMQTNTVDNIVKGHIQVLEELFDETEKKE